MLVWVAKVQIPKVESYLNKGQRNITQPVLESAHSTHYFYCFASHIFHGPRSTHSLSIHQIFLLLLRTGLKSVPALITSFSCSLSVDHDWCLLATAFDTVSIASFLKNKRRISFESLTVKLSSSYWNDSFFRFAEAHPPHKNICSSQQGNGILLTVPNSPASFVSAVRHQKEQTVCI